MIPTTGQIEDSVRQAPAESERAPQETNSWRKPALRQFLITARFAFALLFLAALGYLIYAALTTTDISIYYPIQTTLFTLLPFTLGTLIQRRHPGHTIGNLFLLMAYTGASVLIIRAIGHFNLTLGAGYSPLIDTITKIINHTAYLPQILIPFFFIPIYFPDGKLLSPRWRILNWLVVFFILWQVVITIIHPWPIPFLSIYDTRAFNGIPGVERFFEISNTILSFFTSVIVVPLLFLALYRRYRRSSRVERTQMKWPAFTLVCVIPILIVANTTPAIRAFEAQSGYPIIWSLILAVFVSITLAILQYRLYDINIIINRALVYGGLSLAIIAVYGLIVGAFSLFFHTQNNLLISLLATGLIAVLFQPVRERLQRGANRLLYGERADPTAVLAQLAQQLETADTPVNILPNLVTTIAETLKIPHVAIWLPITENQHEPVAVYGQSPDHVEMISLIYQNIPIGHLVVAPRAPNEAFSPQEMQLLNTIAALTANTVRAVQLSDELSYSRQRIVTSREEERRRLRRDLHDGLGPVLASVALQADTARDLVDSDTAETKEILNSIMSLAQTSVDDVRRLVYNLRPPALDEMGLVGALRHIAQGYQHQLHIQFEVSDLPPLSAAVEVAAYRIIMEALNNVIKHASAGHCWVTIQVDKGLHLIIEDDGIGLVEPAVSGVGLLSMQERAAELGGTCTIHALPTGTRVQAHFPLPSAENP